jgi:hypothetical protein
MSQSTIKLAQTKDLEEKDEIFYITNWLPLPKAHSLGLLMFMMINLTYIS